MSDGVPVIYEVDGRVARITLDRPERGNGITPGSCPSWQRRSSGPIWIPACT